ncbi:MAG: dihydrofolate reductase [Maricaulis sp.]|uniref:dihydrofolate reductase n=1 Tax=Maricaulis sp. TaxID=1486257 RepID=UPI00261DE82B|nr:dihydrofolate reductase [Maricaulis sp.]MDM7985199.1 dihydrofolate reductase [Maricaulis sp.]
MNTIVPRVSLIAARGRNNIIGSDGDLPWRLSSDLKLFKAITKGKPVIMGRKTWESLPRKPLPGRLNIVVTRQAGYTAEGAQVVGDMGDAFDAAFIQANTDRVDEVFVIGGAQIYAAAMTVADRLYLTEVDAAPVGDAAFPEFSEKDWSELGREVYLASEVDDHAFVFRALERV